MRPIKVMVTVAGLVLLLVTAPSDTDRKPTFSSTNLQLERRDQSVTREDLQILIRADEILVDESAWNREDDRLCEDDESANRRSLFCALRRACIDILGTYDHRRIAIQEARFAVEDAAKEQKFAHRLKDYNNRPETTFDDVKKVLLVAQERVNARLPNNEN